MDEANRKLFKDEEYERYVSNLETLVKARTDQLQQFASQNDQLLEFLKQIQSMESLEQVREAVQACIKKFTPEPTQPPKFGGEAGEPVPEVDPEDLKAIWQIGEELRAKHPSRNVATGIEVMTHVCKPGANVEATWYRSSMIDVLSLIAHQQPSLAAAAPWVSGRQVPDPVFRTAASIPTQWLGSEVRQGPHFDVEEFLRRLNEQ